MLKMGEKEIPLVSGQTILEAAKELDIPLSCHSGICGTCQVEVIEGMENLSPYNDSERDMGLGGNMRLCCQLIIKEGLVEIKM